MVYEFNYLLYLSIANPLLHTTFNFNLNLNFNYLVVQL